MSRRAELIDDDDRSRPSIPLRLSRTSSWMETKVKSLKDDDSTDFQSKVHEVSRINQQHSLRSHLVNTRTTIGYGHNAEPDDINDEESGEVASVDAIRDNDDASADITSVGEPQAEDASVQSNGEGDTQHLPMLPHPTSGLSNNPPQADESSSPPNLFHDLSAHHNVTAEISPDEADLEVQWKEPGQDDTQRGSSDDGSADQDGESDDDHPTSSKTGQETTTWGNAKEVLSKRRWLALALSFVIVATILGAVIGSTVGGTESGAVASRLSSPTTSPAGTSPGTSHKCTFCNDGTVPPNLNKSTIRNSTSCLDFYNQLTGLVSTDPLCPTGQALAWRYCGCPSLPSAPANPTCSLCTNGTNLTNASVHCTDLSNLVALVGSSRFASCSDLRAQVLPTCSCSKNATRKTLFR